MLTVRNFFDLSDCPHAALFDKEHVWSALSGLKSYLGNQAYPNLFTGVLRSGIPLPETVVYHEGTIFENDGLEIEFGDVAKGKLLVRRRGEELDGASVIMAGAVLYGSEIMLGQGVLIESGAFVKGPVIIGDRSEVRQGAYIRGNCLIGRRCVVGHVTEVKHAIFLDDAKAGHFAYLGDSILGNRVNLGAGTKLANLRFMGGAVRVKTAQGPVDTGLRKLGAILGDDVQTGCNSVTNPGTLLGKRGIILPNTTAPSGYHADGSIIR